MKITGLHVLTHTDDKEHGVHCVVCDYAIAHNITPVLTHNLQDFKIENTELIAQKEITKNYNFIISSIVASNQLFSRPPPFLL